MVAQMRDDPEAEKLVELVSAGSLNVRTLADHVERSCKQGFSLLRQGNMTGKHDTHNYKSASQEFRAQTHKSLLKRLAANKTKVLDGWTGEIDCIPFADCALNPMGAVPYKYEPDRARACDDMVCNDDITAPYFRPCALQQIRDRSFQGCSYAKCDIDSAFPCMPLDQADLP
jgi:hypothetical protein